MHLCHISDVATKETLISGFQRELGNVATSAIAGKELEESVRMMYRKFVLGVAAKERVGTKHMMSAATAKQVGQGVAFISSRDRYTHSYHLNTITSLPLPSFPSFLMDRTKTRPIHPFPSPSMFTLFLIGLY